MNGHWRHEETTKTIRALPSNHWIASMDSWDGAENHAANTRLIAAAPELLEVCQAISDLANGQGQLNMVQVAGWAKKVIDQVQP